MIASQTAGQGVVQELVQGVVKPVLPIRPEVLVRNKFRSIAHDEFRVYSVILDVHYSSIPFDF